MSLLIPYQSNITINQIKSELGRNGWMVVRSMG